VIKAEFIIITPVFSVTWPFTNHSDDQETFMIIINVENNFVETDTFFSSW